MNGDVEVYGRIIEDRDISILFQEKGGCGVREFLPKSQIAVVYQADGTVKVTMPEWLAKKKGLY
ncbi:MAG: hypothetical protein ACYC6G_14040 [Desulfobaccales bacterium]